MVKPKRAITHRSVKSPLHLLLVRVFIPRWPSVYKGNYPGSFSRFNPWRGALCHPVSPAPQLNIDSNLRAKKGRKDWWWWWGGVGCDPGTTQVEDLSQSPTSCFVGGFLLAWTRLWFRRYPNIFPVLGLYLRAFFFFFFFKFSARSFVCLLAV